MGPFAVFRHRRSRSHPARSSLYRTTTAAAAFRPQQHGRPAATGTPGEPSQLPPSQQPHPPVCSERRAFFFKGTGGQRRCIRRCGWEMDDKCSLTLQQRQEANLERPGIATSARQRNSENHAPWNRSVRQRKNTCRCTLLQTQMVVPLRSVIPPGSETSQLLRLNAFSCVKTRDPHGFRGAPPVTPTGPSPEVASPPPPPPPAFSVSRLFQPNLLKAVHRCAAH